MTLSRAPASSPPRVHSAIAEEPSLAEKPSLCVGSPQLWCSADMLGFPCRLPRSSQSSVDQNRGTLLMPRRAAATRIARFLLTVFVLHAASHAQEYLYTLSNYYTPQLQKIDARTGALVSSLPVTGTQVLLGFTMGVDGDLYAIDGWTGPISYLLVRIARNTGAVTVIGPLGYSNWNFRQLCLNPANGVLYAATDNVLYSVSTTTGAATFIANIAGGGMDQLTTLAIDCHGVGYFTDAFDTGLFTLDLATGQASFIGNIGGETWTPPNLNAYTAIAFDTAGVLHGARYYGGLYTIDTTTAQQTLQWPGIYRGLAFNPESFLLSASTTGSGTGDLRLRVSLPPANATHVWLLGSATPAPGGLGTGQFFGLFFPDALLFAFLGQTPASGSPLHFPVAGSPYTSCPLVLPAGTFSSFAGLSFDLTAIAYSYSAGIVGQSNFARLNW